MWLTAPNRIGIASWQQDDSVWRYEVAGGAVGPTLMVANQSISLCHPSGQPLPLIDEQFVRSDELHWSFSQTESNEFGFRSVVRPVQIPGWTLTPGQMAFEWIVSVQTSLLDSHPTLDLVLPGSSASGGAPNAAKMDEFADLGALTCMTESPGLRAAVLLGGRDAPFTEVITQDSGPRLRLFGQFLEKGVIRRARPWILLDRTSENAATTLNEQVLRNAAETLAASPLPLN